MEGLHLLNTSSQRYAQCGLGMDKEAESRTHLPLKEKKLILALEVCFNSQKPL